MNSEPPTKHFSWGCLVAIDPTTGFPTSRAIRHSAACACPSSSSSCSSSDDETICLVILERAHELHQSNAVRYSIPAANEMARRAARALGLLLAHGLEGTPAYRGKVYWRDGVCVEILGRGFTDAEFAALREGEPGSPDRCEWLL
ncbi:hypothetical protein F4780DRAFT_764494 [Xylariomycetidae sp. FL0641]|nr:hypothetical protein F4780DRAFT_764494 [Xylariomycetidae sp. FL0641]